MCSSDLDESGACQTNADGTPVFPRPRDVLDQGYTDFRFREATGINANFTPYGTNDELLNQLRANNG